MTGAVVAIFGISSVSLVPGIRIAVDIRIEVRVDPKDISAPNVGGDRKLEGRQPSIESAFPVDRDRDVVVGDPHVAEAVGRLHSLLPFLQLRALEGEQGFLQPEDAAVKAAHTDLLAGVGVSQHTAHGCDAVPVDDAPQDSDVVAQLLLRLVIQRYRDTRATLAFAGAVDDTES